MSLQWGEREVRIPALYFGVVCIAAALPFVAGSPFAGIWAVLLTAPWSVLVVAIADGAGTGLLDTGWFPVASVLVAGLLNASLLHVAMRRGAVRSPKTNRVRTG